MTLLDHLRTSRRRTLTLATATTVALLGVSGPSPATAANKPPAPLGTSDSTDPLGLQLGSQPDSKAKPPRPAADGSGGFIYRNGRYTPLDSVDGLLTAHTALNNRGQTAGSYLRSEFDPGGFVRSRSGDYTRIDVAPGPSTLVVDVNDRGTTVGLSGDAVTLDAQSFLRKRKGDVTPIEVPGAQLTGALGVNNRGAVVGTYIDANGVNQAFVTQRGKVTTIAPPDAATDPARSQVVATDLNDRGHVVGCYADDQGTYHGFRYDHGRFTIIDHPDGADVPDAATTCPLGINNHGHVVGQYVDATGVLHGYLWRPKRGFDTVDLPRGAPAVGPDGKKGTVAADINDQGDILLPFPGAFLKARGVPVGG